MFISAKPTLCIVYIHLLLSLGCVHVRFVCQVLCTAVFPAQVTLSQWCLFKSLVSLS